MSLTDKVVVITGGARGIGYQIADKFLRNNAKVIIILDINEDEGTKAAANLNNSFGNGRAVFMKCDVTKDLQNIYDNIIGKYQTVDVLVNNAGIHNEKNAKQTIEINVLGVINWSEKFYEHMRKDKNGKGGTIINMSSIGGFIIIHYAPIYQASKFAIFGYTRCLGDVKNYDRTGVRVVGICPGFTETALMAEAKPWDENMIEELETKYLPKQEWQSAEAVGEAAVEVFEKAPSGTLWVIAGGKPIYEAPRHAEISLIIS